MLGTGREGPGIGRMEKKCLIPSYMSRGVTGKIPSWMPSVAEVSCSPGLYQVRPSSVRKLCRCPYKCAIARSGDTSLPRGLARGSNGRRRGQPRFRRRHSKPRGHRGFDAKVQEGPPERMLRFPIPTLADPQFLHVPSLCSFTQQPRSKRRNGLSPSGCQRDARHVFRRVWRWKSCNMPHVA